MTLIFASDAVTDDVWSGLYGESWRGLIRDDAFAHPAKFSRGLIRRIYDHVIEEGWATKGNSVVDPFGGVALGGFDAMRLGLNWYGCELEARFVGLGNQNIALWNGRFSRMPNWGTARLVQGDSRKLGEVLSEADFCVSSPPYVNAQAHPPLGSINKDHWGADGRDITVRRGLSADYADETAGQLGAMKEGDLNLTISSPPYIHALGNAKNYADPEKAKKDAERDIMRVNAGASPDKRYGVTDGNLGAMPEGQLCVTSPPYNPPMSQDHNGSRGGQRGTTPSEKGAFVKYGTTDGQLEGMSMAGHEIAISSPPFPQPYTGGGGINVKGYGDGSDKVGQRTYQSKGGDRTEGNLETLDANGFECAVSSPPYEETLEGYGGATINRTIEDKETFWSASRLILEQLHQVVVPGGHAVFVVKAFVRDKKIVDFPAQWAQLCEAVGFRLLHHHRASLVEHSGTQGGFDRDKEIRVERKSFFRRLAEAKGSPRIDHESVLCFKRI